MKSQIESGIGPRDGASQVEYKVEEIDLVDEFKRLKETKKIGTSTLQEVTAEHLKATGNFNHALKGQEHLFQYLFFSLFYEEIYSPMPGVFRFKLQKYPLDLETSWFIEHRREWFDQRFDELQQKDARQILELIKEQRKKNASLQQITKFKSITPESIKHLLICLGKDTLLDCLRRLSESYYNCKDGPNLILYNFDDMKPTANSVRFVECHDARDKPSDDCLLWIEFLNSKNVSADVVSVKISE